MIFPPHRPTLSSLFMASLADSVYPLYMSDNFGVILVHVEKFSLYVRHRTDSICQIAQLTMVPYPDAHHEPTKGTGLNAVARGNN